MPIPFLPTEIIAEIVSHLRTPVHQSVNDSIVNGCSISLVCRQFAPIGQALRWRVVKTNPSSIHSLARHFEEFPHLAKLVRLLIQPQLFEETDEDVEEEVPAFEAQSLDALLQVLTSTISLIYLEFKADNNESSRSALHRIFRTTGALPQLREFILEITGTDAWTAQVARAFNLGFPVLDSLTLDLSIDSTPGDGLDAPLASGSRLPIEDLTAFIGGSVVEAMRLGFDLFNRLDPLALRRCALGGHVAHDVTYAFLSTCSSLSRLEITMCPHDVLISSSALFDQLSHLQCLNHLGICVYDRETATTTLGETNIPFHRVLTAFPASLESVCVALSFNDYETIPHGELPESPRSKPVRMTAVRPEAGGDYQVVHVWKEEQEETGRAQWYRGEVEGEDWRSYFG
ncbi:uncharacterized protein JCM6883_003795 [Sporobolomyces salmoneus]|uniref:uncharacterized protein n=1 Tax=Sporobolomyces salmoneus TaxID=183962 RepID=UPI00317825C5